MDQQQAQNQAQGQEGVPTPAPAVAPQTQNQPRTLEEREEAWRQADGILRNSLANLCQAARITEEQIGRFEQQIGGIRNNHLQRRQAVSDLCHVSENWRREREALPELSENLLQRYENDVQRIQNDIRPVYHEQLQFMGNVTEQQQTWTEQHRARIEMFRSWPQANTASRIIQLYFTDCNTPYPQSGRGRQHQCTVNWYQVEANSHQLTNQALRTQQLVPFPPPPPPQAWQQPVQTGHPPPKMGHPPPKMGPQPPYQAPQQQIQRLQPQRQQHRGQTHAGPPKRPYRIGGAAPSWSPEEEKWLVVHAMYNLTTTWLARNIPGGNNRSTNSIHGHLTEMRTRGKLPASWTIRAPAFDDCPWTIEEDMELMRWHAHGRTFIDAQVFFEYDRSGTAAYVRARYLLEDPELARRVIEIENRQREILLELDTNADSGMPGVDDETADEEQGTEELRQAILDSLAARPPYSALDAVRRHPL